MSLGRWRGLGGILVLVVGLLAAACGPTLQVNTDYDHNIRFNQFRTYRFGEGRLLSQGAVSPDTLVKDRIDDAIKAQLAADGLRYGGEQADLVVRWVAGARTVQELQSVGYMAGPWPYATGAYPVDFWVEDIPEGTLVIDLVDAETGKLVWRAYCRAEGSGFTEPAFINKTVARAFEKYPPRA